MQFVKVGALILVLLMGWVSVRAEPRLVSVLSGCTAGAGGGPPPAAAPPPRAS